MNLKETETLLREMFAIDGRKLEAEKIAAWRESLSSMQLDVAQAALRKCRADERISYVEPKHIWGKAKEAAQELDRIQQQQQVAEEQVKPVVRTQPTCKHDKLLLSCNACCRDMNNFHETHGDVFECAELCHNFAKENLLA